MQPRKQLAIALGFALVCGVSVRASAQNESPFTIRYPPDGATVREKVNVRIPLASIPQSGYVSMYIDGDFRGALSISDTERKAIQDAALANNEPAYFDYKWDTKLSVKQKFTNKESIPADGQHTIMARLYEPKSGGGSILKETSAVTVIVANKFDPGNIGPIKLQYKFVDGENRDYSRGGIASVVAGLSQGMTGTSDQELISFKSDLVVAVEDKYANGNAMVRNRMKRLEVKQGGQVSFYPSEELPSSLFQELDPIGNVVYQNSNFSFDQFAQLGIPVSATLDLPLLPRGSVSVGDTWRSTGKIEIPGTSPDQQPTVELESKFEGFEWEGGHPTARIRQTFDSAKAGGFKTREIMFGTIPVSNPAVKYEQDIFVAYRSGKLVKVNRKIEVVGKTNHAVGGASSSSGAGAAGGAPGGSGIMMGSGGTGMMPGMGGAPYGGAGGAPGFASGAGYGRGPGGSAGPGGGGPGGAPYGGGGGPRGGSPRGGSPRGGQRGGGGAGGGKFGGGGDEGLGGADGGFPGGGGIRGGGGGIRGGVGGGIGGAAGGGAIGSGDGMQQITLKSTTTTELNAPATTGKPAGKPTPGQ